jgi:murein DD-endopeptidase MepM/ murein hydrolase activator NlpD
MATLTEVIKSKRQSGQSRTSSLVGSLKDKLAEKFDPRQVFNQTGVLTALFPKLKAFKSGSTSYDSISKGRSGEQLQNTTKDDSVKRVEKNTQIFAKNTLSLRILSAEVSIMGEDISGLLKALNVKPSKKADAYFKSSSEMEKQYESKFKEKDSSKIKSVAIKRKRSSGLLGVLGVVGGLGVAYLLVDFFQNKEQSILSDMKEKLSPIVTDFSSDIQTFISSSMSSLEKNFTDLQDRMSKQTDKFSDDFEKVFSMKTIEDYFMRDISPTETFSKSIEGFKNSMMQELSNFSFIPSAQAATLPSSFPTLTRPGAAPDSTGTTGSTTQVSSGSELKGQQKEFYDKIYITLLEEATKAGVKNPEVIARLGAAQSSIETGYGKATAGGNNYFGIKGSGGNQQTTKEYDPKTGEMITQKASFRQYGSMRESVADYIKFLQTNSRYKEVLAAGSVGEAITAQGKTGYATDPGYTRKLALVQSSATGKGVNLPASPLTSLAQTALGPNVASRVTRGYGTQEHPLLGVNKLHTGIDIAAPSGTSVFSVKDGKISFVGFDKGYGNYIIVDHNDGTSTLYGHLSRFVEGLSTGTIVTKGQTIGFVGSTGLSSGPHLHFELRRNGKPVSELTSMSEQQALVGNQLATNTIIIPKREIVQGASPNESENNVRKIVDPVNKLLDYASRTA